jgi:hypothetical protein
MYLISSGSIRKALLLLSFALAMAFTVTGQSLNKHTVKFNFGMQGIFRNTVSADPLSSAPSNANIADVPVVIGHGDGPNGIFFHQADLFYRRMIRRSIGLVGSVGYLWYNAEVHMDPDRRIMLIGAGGINMMPASPRHSFRANAVLAKAGGEYVFSPFESKNLLAFTLSPGLGYICFISASQGYYKNELIYDYYWDEYSTQEVRYYKAWYEMPGVFFVSIASGFERMFPSLHIGVYANFEISKFFGRFVPQSEVYYRSEEKMVRIAYDNALGLGLKGNLGIMVRLGKSSSRPHPSVILDEPNGTFN